MALDGLPKHVHVPANLEFLPQTLNFSREACSRSSAAERRLRTNCPPPPRGDKPKVSRTDLPFEQKSPTAACVAAQRALISESHHCIFLHHFLFSNKARVKIPNTAAALWSRGPIFGGIHIIPYCATTSSCDSIHRRQAGLQHHFGIFPLVTAPCGKEGITALTVCQVIIIPRSVRGRR